LIDTAAKWYQVREVIIVVAARGKRSFGKKTKDREGKDLLDDVIFVCQNSLATSWLKNTAFDTNGK